MAVPTTEYDLEYGVLRHAKRARPTWDEYFLGIASAVARRGDCVRSRVGAVLVRPDRRIASTGYNGSPPGGPSCLDGGCIRCSSDVPSGAHYEGCIETHAEANCLLYADWSHCQGATLYITRSPCTGCSKLIRSSGVALVVWPEGRWTL
ncbi:deoxycytidylate deaminase [Streptomyces sp. NPDC018045]|uniref:deoxycytidylate deaminase n=1 Tax=Streptomyces sp. NPDC018045 TaxID=3365037 RepID=UPI0037B8884B